MNAVYKLRFCLKYNFCQPVFFRNNKFNYLNTYKKNISAFVCYFNNPLSCGSLPATLRCFSSNSIKCEINYPEKVTALFQKLRHIRRIKAAAKENGVILELNPKLVACIEEAKKYDLSESSIDTILRLVSDTRSGIGIHEILFPGRCLIVAQYEGIDLAYIEHQFLEVCEKYDVFLVSGESRRHLYYDHKGIVIVNGSKDGQLTAPDNTIISEIGIESVKHGTYYEENFLKFICDPSSLIQVKRSLEHLGYNVEEAYVGYIPKIIAKLPNKSIEKVFSLIADVSEIPEVDRIYDNLE